MIYYGIDITYIVLVLPAVIFALIAQGWVNSAFKKYSDVPTARRITAAKAAEMLLSANGVRGIKIERCAGNLTDHFDPRSNSLRLSQSVYDSCSVAAVGIAAHECGHAIQYDTGYAPIKLRSAIIPISKFGSSLAVPLILLGFIFSLQILVTFGIVFFAAAVVFQLVTLPVEFNASRRAIDALESASIMDGGELAMTKKVLGAAAMTYVAALAVSLAQLLRLILIFGGRRRR